jgi:hypothetical protein
VSAGTADYGIGINGVGRKLTAKANGRPHWLNAPSRARTDSCISCRLGAHAWRRRTFFTRLVGSAISRSRWASVRRLGKQRRENTCNMVNSSIASGSRMWRASQLSVETWFTGPKTVTTNEAVGNLDTTLRYAHDLLPGVEAPAPSCGLLLHVKSDRGLGGTIAKMTA